MAQLAVTLQVRMPWWMGPYISCLIILCRLGFAVDLEKAAAFLARHLRYRAGERGHWKRISQREGR